MFALFFELPVEAAKAYLRWTFTTTGDNLLWGLWIGVGLILPLVSQLLRLPVVGGIQDITAIRILISLSTLWWWWGLGLLVVIYGGIWLNLRR